MVRSLPKVAVITPTKNRLDLLREAMGSVELQTFKMWEHIIIDDGSDDGTAEEVWRRTEQDRRIRYLKRTGFKAGANVCRNLGIREANAEFIVFLDSDDRLEADCLERRVKIIERNLDIDFVVFGGGVFVKQIGEHAREPTADLLGDDLLRFLTFDLPWIITGPIWRKTSLLRLGLLDETLLSWQDVELHVRALTAGLRYLRFPYIDHHVRWQFEETKVSVQQRRSPKHLKAAIQVIETLECHVRQGPGMDWIRQRGICSLYFFIAERWVERDDIRAALRAWRHIRTRGLGTQLLHLTGSLWLLLQAVPLTRRLGERIAHKWKGWMRLRINAELIKKTA
jgi:glycosyltransferase involved in cell wall biosynthesis